jgi:hypothetical protein
MTYNKIPLDQLSKEKKYLTSSIFKLLPYKQEGYEHLDNYFESVLQRLIGFNSIIDSQAEMITIISLIEYARKEADFTKYRKAILDACGMMQSVVIIGGDCNA